MGMVLEVMAVSRETAEKVRHGGIPDATLKLVSPDDWNFLSSPDEDVANGHELLGLDTASEEGSVAYLDKAWHMVIALCAGQAEWSHSPLLPLLDGEPLTEEDVGMGPPIWTTPELTKQVHNALAPIDRDWLLQNWDPDRLIKQDIYLAESIDPKDPDNQEYVLGQGFEHLKALIKTAADNGWGLVSTMG